MAAGNNDPGACWITPGRCHPPPLAGLIPSFDGPHRTRHWKAMTSKSTPWRATILTLFPEMFPGPLGVSLAGKALSAGLWALEARDIRASANDRHRSVDDTPAGGGP